MMKTERDSFDFDDNIKEGQKVRETKESQRLYWAEDFDDDMEESTIYEGAQGISPDAYINTYENGRVYACREGGCDYITQSKQAMVMHLMEHLYDMGGTDYGVIFVKDGVAVPAMDTYDQPDLKDIKEAIKQSTD